MREPQISDAETDEVLAGRRPDGREDLARVADAMAWLRIQSQTAAPPQLGSELQERMTVPLAGGPWRARRGARASALSLAAAATIVLGLVVSGSQGVLPGPVQAVVADVGDAVGLAFPRPSGDPDLVSGPGESAWSRSDSDGSRVGSDGESAADDGALGTGDDPVDDGGAEGAGGDELSADRWCGDWPDGVSGEGRAPGQDVAASSPGVAEPPLRTGGRPGVPVAGVERGDPEQQGRDGNSAGRSHGGEAGVDGDDARDGDGWPDAEWCERAGAAGH